MTIKELADVAGVSEDTIRRKGKALFPGMHRKGIKTVYTERQCKVIMEEVKKKNLVSPAPQNAEVAPQNAEVNYEIIGKMIGMAVQAALVPVVDRLERISVPSLLEPVKEDRFTLLGYAKNKGIALNRSELAIHGRNLSRIAKEKEMTLEKIPDERWGTVNSYPVIVLDEYFGG